MTAEPPTCNDSAAGPPPIPPDISTQTWPQLGTLTMEFISKNCPTLFQGLGFLGPPVDFDLDPRVKPIHAPVHRQPVSKLDSIKKALDTYETMGQLVRVSQPTDWISNMIIREREPTPTKPGKIRICLDPSQTLNKAIRCPKYIIPTQRRTRGEPSQVTWHEIHDSDPCQRSLSEHPSDITIIPDDHHVHTMGLLQVDKATIWHIVSVWRVATLNPYGLGRPPSHQHRRLHPISRMWHYRCGGQDRSWLEPHCRTLVLRTASCQAKPQQNEIPRAGSSVHGSRHYHWWPSAQPSYHPGHCQQAHSKGQTRSP